MIWSEHGRNVPPRVLRRVAKVDSMPVHPWVRGNWGGCLSNCLLEVRLEAVRSGLDRGGCQGGRGCVGVVDAAGAAGPGR